jgi:hypothetical protein
MHETSSSIYFEISKERPECERQAVFHDHICDGRSTMEHALTYRGKQIPDKWAIVRLCEWAHGVGKYALGGGLDKRKNEYLALLHATPKDLKAYPKKDWKQLKYYLSKKYGK